MKKLLLSLALMCAATCGKAQNTCEIIPRPNSLEAREGVFDLRRATVECDPAFDAATQKAVEGFATRLSDWLGNKRYLANRPVKFTLDPSLSPEAYTLDVARKRIDIRAADLRGAIYAIRSLSQLMPADFHGGPRTLEPRSVPCVKIADAPRFGYRGMHLDESRHFFGVDEVKRYLDIMSLHKLNTLHWHLTDDQGWRIEIKRYPELTTVGGFRDETMIRKEWGNYDGIRYGGFYTQDQIREVVDYAASIGITIIPEIDLPGHMLAALTAYPNLGCTGGPYKVWGRWGVADDVLCPGNPETFTFLEGVLSEVIELFPSKYIHIGGDECPKVRWEKCPKCQALIAELGLTASGKFKAEHFLQSYVMERIEEFLAAHNRKIIGWDEILEGEVSENATIMSWRGSEGGIHAAKIGRDVIMTPNSHFYFDYYQTDNTANEPLAIGGNIPVERVYSFDASLSNELTPAEASHILGVQANLWTEYIPNSRQLEYMLLPRLAALSEVQWCRDETKNWDRFVSDLVHICDIYTRRGYNFATHAFDITASRRVDPERACVELTFTTQGNAPIHYTLDGTEPTTASMRYTAPLEIRRGCTVKAIVKRPGIDTHMFVQKFADSKSLGKPAVLNTAPHEKYTSDGATLLTDGVHGESAQSAGEWIGYETQPLDVTIDMGGRVEYSSVGCTMLVQPGSGVFPPASFKIYTSTDGNDFGLVAETTAAPVGPDDTSRVETYTVTFPATSARWVRVVADTIGKIPEWHPHKGRNAFIFTDEIAVN
jgi:hexosaminidase